MAQQHTGGHWSAANPIPTIQKFLDDLDRGKKDRDKRIDEELRRRKEAKVVQDSNSSADISPNEQERILKNHAYQVTDPITGKQVHIEDVGREFMKDVKDPKLTVPNANLGKDTTIKTDSNQPLDEYKRNQDITAPPEPIAEGTTSDVPIHGEKTNILFHPTPTVTYKPMFDELEKRGTWLTTGIFIAVIALGRIFGGSFWGLIPLSVCVSSGIFLWMKGVVRSGREMEWHSERLRGETATLNLLPESVEWMNALLSVIWGLLNPEMLASIADTVEDVMQASAPGFIENVRIAEIDQGSNPIRILSIRSLPDGHVKQLIDNVHEEKKKNKNPPETVANEEGGDYYNMEVSFAYHAIPSGQSTLSRAHNMHMQLIFYLGIRGLFGVPLPVFAELIELVGTVRLRLQMTPEPPFAKSLTFTFMGLPHIRAGCLPLVKRGVNILNLPLISNFVNYAIRAAASLYVAPKSMSLDLGMMFRGDDIQKDTLALGVLWVRIHRATDLSKQDRHGSNGGGSDPYINLSFSKYRKPMYCTRVITNDLNPVWEEATALLVTPEIIKADEMLSIELWDSDRNTADDIVGKVESSIQKLIQQPRKMYSQVSRLQGMDKDSEMPGKLHWEVGYFGKPKLRPGLRTDGKNIELPETLRNEPLLQDEKGIVTTDDEEAVAHTPPDPLWPSGICSVVIHQIVNLQFENIRGSQFHRGREYEPAKPYGENTEEEGRHLPTSYCTILLNDQLVYHTRAKAVSSKPIFNAGTERFVRDWRSTVVVVTVRDQRYREHDPILGVVSLKLSDLMKTSSQVTRWYPLDGGIGFGRIRISLLFRSVETKLPLNMLGWDVGTVEFLSDRITAKNFNQPARIKLRTGGSIGKLPRSLAQTDIDGSYYYDLTKNDPRLKLPVKYRYRSPVVFEFHVASKRGAVAYALLWLQHLVDNEETPIDLPIWKTKHGGRLTQNYITEENWKGLHLNYLNDVDEVGRLQFAVRFSPGMDESHKRFAVGNDARETFETWEACFSEGIRSDNVEVEVPPEVKDLHEKSIGSSQDVQKDLGPDQDKRWINADETDWTLAFGENLHALTDEEERRRKAVRKSDDATKESATVKRGFEQEEENSSYYDDDNNSDSESQERSNGSMVTTNADYTFIAGSGSGKGNQSNKRSERRKHRGVMQWRPVRSAQFVKDETKIALSKIKKKIGMGDLAGREPDVETETGS